ncbi:heterokaryon incompatibility protein-domain-containing protein, partial [Lasiosphaeria hispida]
YQPLDEASQTIRLLRIHPPSESSSELECTLFPARLEGNPQFTALSYVWGDPTIKETIIVNGWPIKVTINLATALRHLQVTNVRPILDSFWADGICIDQSNLKERGSQVALMGQLHRQATLVCSWMG